MEITMKQAVEWYISLNDSAQEEVRLNVKHDADGNPDPKDLRKTYYQEINEWLNKREEETEELVVIVIPTDTDFTGTNDVTYEELAEYIEENEGDEDAYSEYSLGDYFTAQNDENLPMHWSYLIDKKKKVLLNAN